ncbi:Splicing factor spf30 [Colletotrichum truncatum]|uniref:Splicing factor spf30 n=1 Tax=Colletotrichum truncatum TaxID=5467 RepID=A0ACC3YQP8_COLTU|nr:Splicing factor spf30 [Colletotrichum truncatum]KAF6796579.1 Splicing factor spf30 [Colletotrichum truncatum]
MSSQIATLEEDRKQYQEQLDVVYAGLKDDPDNAELKNLQAELNDMISLLDESLAELQPKQAPKPAPQKAASPPPPEKWSKENHPAFKKVAPAPEEKDDAAPVSYQVNDTVMAKWVSGDRGFYPARITSITGSSTAPIYIVKFKSYDNTDTLRAKDIRPMSTKRKADGTPASGLSTAQQPAQPTPPRHTGPSNGVVTSAAASLYPEQQAKLDAEKNADGAPKPPKAKKIKATKELEKGKSKWQEFNSKSKFGKTQKKDSMFRTPDGVHGRVGFTGSGQAMRKDPTRSRHVYQQNEELD